MVSIEDSSMSGGGYALKQMIWNAARDTIRSVNDKYEVDALIALFLMTLFTLMMYCSEWTGQQLAECSLYGVRVYKEGAILATHVDRKLYFACYSSLACNLLHAFDIYNLFPLQAYRWLVQPLSMLTRTSMNHG
jgi:hypothetical protein